MTPESQRIAIAEACGWRHRIATLENPVEYCGMRLPNYFSNSAIDAWWKEGDAEHTGVYCMPPRYLTDLTEMHKAIAGQTYEIRRTIAQNAVLSLMTEEGDTFDDALAIMFIPAAKLAELLLRALGKWVDTK